MYSSKFSYFRQRTHGNSHTKRKRPRCLIAVQHAITRHIKQKSFPHRTIFFPPSKLLPTYNQLPISPMKPPKKEQDKFQQHKAKGMWPPQPPARASQQRNPHKKQGTWLLVVSSTRSTTHKSLCNQTRIIHFYTRHTNLPCLSPYLTWYLLSLHTPPFHSIPFHLSEPNKCCLALQASSPSPSPINHPTTTHTPFRKKTQPTPFNKSFVTCNLGLQLQAFFLLWSAVLTCQGSMLFNLPPPHPPEINLLSAEAPIGSA